MQPLWRAVVDRVEAVLAKFYYWEKADPPPRYERVNGGGIGGRSSDRLAQHSRRNVHSR